MAPRISSFCFGEACAGVWSRQGSDASLVLETVFLFVVLWLALTTLAVVREMAWRRGREAVTDKTTNAPLRRLVRQIGLLNERCPARTLHDTRGRAEQCAICLDALDASVPVRELPCAHRFHIGCIDRWVLQTLTREDASATCPICKASILELPSGGDVLIAV